MIEQKDCREELVNSICNYLMPIAPDLLEVKSMLYILTSDYEIFSRCTEVAELHQDRNEILLKRFLVAKKVKNCSERTLEFYGITIKKIFQEVGKTVDDITADDIRFYMAKRLVQDKVSEVTVGNEIRALSSFFTWATNEEIVQRNPMGKVEQIKTQKVKKEALTDMEVEKLRMVAEGLKEKLIIEMLLSTGCRVSELVNIKMEEIDGDRVLIHGKGHKDRYVYLNARAQLALQTYLAKRKDKNAYLFPKGTPVTEMEKLGIKHAKLKDWWMDPNNVRSEDHMDKSSVEGITRKMAKRAGVKQANPHKFRRTCATMALRKGMPIEQVSKMLGHESIETTQIYLDLTEEELALAHRKYVV